jgi:hypothetical protein
MVRETPVVNGQAPAAELTRVNSVAAGDAFGLSKNLEIGRRNAR